MSNVRFTPKSGHASAWALMSAKCHKRTFAKARRRDSSQRVKNGQVHRHRRSPLGAEADISRPEARPARLH